MGNDKQPDELQTVNKNTLIQMYRQLEKELADKDKKIKQLTNRVQVLSIRAAFPPEVEEMKKAQSKKEST